MSEGDKLPLLAPTRFCSLNCRVIPMELSLTSSMTWSCLKPVSYHGLLVANDKATKVATFVVSSIATRRPIQSGDVECSHKEVTKISHL